MSVENVEKFFALVRGDQDLAVKIKAIDHTNQDSALSQLVQLASERGFPFTAKDHTEAVKRRAQARHKAAERDGAEMAAAAGVGPFRSDTEAGGGETCIVTDDCDYCETHGTDCNWTEWIGCGEE
jgi:predicted ribosomally synthesized peptide with nif11-like leader